MLRTILINIIRIVFLVLLQNLVVSRIDLFDGLIFPWIYIFGILMLPFETPRWLTMGIGFVVGLLMDYFSGPIGLHTSACVTIAYIQPIVQKILSPREGYDITQKPTVQRMGLAWYLTYAGVLTLVHHSWFFFMEVFRFSDFFYQMVHILLSTITTLLLMTIGQYLIYNSKSTQL
jgi:rod shape-determining protein MreD